ncbi:MAG: SMC-Scp complex subunit ScpB [Terriglobia bacterium]
MNRAQLKAVLQAIIYASEEPATVAQLEKVFPDTPRPELKAALAELVEASRMPDSGIEVRKVAGGYRMYTKPEHHEAVRRFVRSRRPPLRLSRPALETLAVVAYKQPVTLPEIQAVRGVDPSTALATLLDKGLVATAGRKQCVGRPILYKTGEEFLLRFGLNDLGELPTLKEFEALARASLGELEPVPAAAEREKEPPAREKEAADVGGA